MMTSISRTGADAFFVGRFEHLAKFVESLVAIFHFPSFRL